MSNLRSPADCRACGTGAYYCQLRRIEDVGPCCSRCSHKLGVVQ